jgi:hypothetical protein
MAGQAQSTDLLHSLCIETDSWKLHANSEAVLRQCANTLRCSCRQSRLAPLSILVLRERPSDLPFEGLQPSSLKQQDGTAEKAHASCKVASSRQRWKPLCSTHASTAAISHLCWRAS